MSRIHPEGHDSDHPDRLLADVLLRQEPDEEEDEEEDGGDGNGKDKEDVDDDDDGYSECACPLYFSGGRMKREHFVELVEEALDSLPQEFRSRKPSVANDRLAPSDTQVETSDGEGVRCRCDCQINIVTATDVSQLLTRTAPHATTLHIQAEGLHIISDGAFRLNTVGEPAVITVDFVIRQHRSLIFQDSDDRTFELPAFTPPPQRLPSDGFFERDAAHLLSALSTHPGVTSEKALASFANKQLTIRGRCCVMYRAAPSFI